MAHVPRHGRGTHARLASLEGEPAVPRTGATPVFVDGSGRRSRHVRGVTALLLLVLFLFVMFAVGIVKSATDAPVRWSPKPGVSVEKVNP